MAVTTRVPLYTNPETLEPEEIIRGKSAVYEFDVQENDQSLRDVTSDTIEVACKDSGLTARTWVVTKVDAPNGRISLSISSVQTTGSALGTMTIDVLVNDAPRLLMEVEVVDSESN